MRTARPRPIPPLGVAGSDEWRGRRSVRTLGRLLVLGFGVPLFEALFELGLR